MANFGSHECVCGTWWELTVLMALASLSVAMM